MAEWSKALALGASSKERGFEPHSCHFEVAVQMRVPPLLFAAKILAYYLEQSES